MKTSRFISLLLCVVMIMSLFTGLAGSASADDVIIHEVKSGDVLVKICAAYGLNYYTCKDAIKKLNGFATDDQLGKLSVGQQLKLPASDAVATTLSGTAPFVTTTSGGTTTTTTTTYSAPTMISGNVAYYLTAYTVQAGDTLAGICGKLNSNYYYYSPVILAVNSLANANFIRPGQVLLIPTPVAGGTGYAVVAHQVQPGETMTAICNQYGVNYQAMRTLINGVNRRDNMDKIYVGQTVYVPSTGAGAVTTTVVTSGTGTVTSSGTVATGAGYTITFATGGAFASANGSDYVSSAPAGVEVSVWSNAKAGYAVKSLQVIRTDTGAPVPVDYNYFTMPNSNVYVDVAFEKGLIIQKAKAQGGTFETSVGGFLSDAAFAGDVVTILAYPNQYYSVKSVSYQKTDGTVSAVDVKKDASGNYSFTMPSYPIKLSVSFAPTQYHQLSYSGIVGNGKVTFSVDGKEVKQAEQGETVTMKFVADPNWAFNTSDFENNLTAHIPNKSSMGSFKKIDDTTYTFVMGTKDINVVGVQFLNRNTYVISAAVYPDMNGLPNGSIYFNVVDQTSGNITYGSPVAKFGDTVQVIYNSGPGYIPDTAYSKANSKGAGNALLAWSSDTTFTMPDSNVTVNARFVQDGATHYYSYVYRNLIPWNGGIVTLESGGNLVEYAEVGKVIFLKVAPKPNYDLSVAKIVAGTPIYAVTLNGRLTDADTGSSDFKYIGYDVATRTYTFSFVKSAGAESINVSFASDYQGVNATFTQKTEGGVLVVQGIKGFAVNGNYVSGDVQVISGDTVSFSVELKEGYEITSVRKYARVKSTGVEIPNTTAFIPGGENNSYSYTVTKDDIGDAGDRELVFEITCRKVPETYYTVKYTEPKIDGETPRFSSTLAPVVYGIGATQISTSTTIQGIGPADIVGLSGNLVDANDVLVEFRLGKDDVLIEDPITHQKHFYTFDKLLLNGEEFSDVDSSTNPLFYLASFILPKDVPDGIVTTEVVFKYFKTVDADAITLTDLKLDSTAITLVPGTFDYTVNTGKTPQDITGTYSIVPDSAEVWLNDVLLYQDDNSNNTLEATPADWVTGPNKLVIKLHEANSTDTTYTITVNYGMEASALTKLTVDGKDVTPDVTDPAHPAALTIYEAATTNPTVPVVLVAGSFKCATWKINGIIPTGLFENTTSTQNIDLQPGDNTLEISVTETDKAPTTYVVHIVCTPEPSRLAKLAIETVDSYNNIYNWDQTDYAVTVTKNPFEFTVDTNGGQPFDYKINDHAWQTGNPSGTPITGAVLDNTVEKNTLLIRTEEAGKLETLYTVVITPDLKPSAMDIYLEMDGKMIKFTSFAAYVNTTKSTAKFEVKNPTTDTITVEVNGVELFSGNANPFVAEVKGGEAVEKWNVGNNVVKFKVVGTDSKETVYTLNVNYQATPLTLTALTRSTVPQGLATYQIWNATTAMTADVIVATPELGTATIRLDGDAGSAGTRTIDWSVVGVGTHYIDIEVESADYVTGTYHIDVNVINP